MGDMADWVYDHFVLPDEEVYEHVCQENTTCTCSVDAVEPDSKCPVHSGYREWPPRCEICGKFMKIKEQP